MFYLLLLLFILILFTLVQRLKGNHDFLMILILPYFAALCSIILYAVSYTHLDVYKRQSIIARPPSIPGIHTESTALARSEITRRSRGRPLNTTATTLGFTSETARNKSCLLYTSRCV